jgi:hypothetical protein
MENRDDLLNWVRRQANKAGFTIVIQRSNLINPIFARIILIIYYVCLHVLVCDYLSLCVFYSGLVDFGLRRVF